MLFLFLVFSAGADFFASLSKHEDKGLSVCSKEGQRFALTPFFAFHAAAMDEVVIVAVSAVASCLAGAGIFATSVAPCEDATISASTISNRDFSNLLLAMSSQPVFHFCRQILEDQSNHCCRCCCHCRRWWSCLLRSNSFCKLCYEKQWAGQKKINGSCSCSVSSNLPKKINHDMI